MRRWSVLEKAIRGRAVITGVVRDRIWSATLPNGKEIIVFTRLNDRVREPVIGEEREIELKPADFSQARLLTDEEA